MKKPMFFVFVIAFFLSVSSGVLAQMSDEKPDYWGIDVEYPHFLTEGEVAITANSHSKVHETADFYMFLDMAKKDVPDLKKMNPAIQYGLKAVPSVTMDDKTIASGFVERLEYTGGAHPNTNYWAMTFAKAGDCVQEIKLADLFVDREKAVGLMSEALRKQIKKCDYVPSLIAEDRWPVLSCYQKDRFAVTQSGLMFLFDRYDLGAGSEGDFKVIVPYSEIEGLDCQGVLKDVIANNVDMKIGKLTSRRWVLQSIEYNNDTEYSDKKMGDTWVEFRNGRYYAKAGINRLQGKYTAHPDGRIEFETGMSTMAANPENSAAAHFEKNLPEIKRFLYDEGYLILELPVDVGIMRLR